MTEDERVEEFIRGVEEKLVYLEDDTRTLTFMSVQLQLEILRELRRRRGEDEWPTSIRLFAPPITGPPAGGDESSIGPGFRVVPGTGG